MVSPREIQQTPKTMTANNVLPRIVRCLFFFAVLLAGSGLFAEPFTGHFFSTDTDFYLGQKRRNLGGGGRVWTNLYYGMTALKPRDTGYKIKPDAYGLQLGFDVVQTHGVYTTFFGNVQRSSGRHGTSAKAEGDNYLLGLGKFAYLGGCHFGGIASVGYDEYKVKDNIQNALSKGSGLQAHLFGEFGADFIFGKWGFKPFYDLQYDFLYHGRIGKAQTAFSGDWNGHSFNHNFGMRINWKIIETVEWQVRASWIHEFLRHPPPFYNSRFSAVHGTMTPSILFYNGDTGRDWAWLGCGFKFEGIYNIYLFLDYDALLNARHTTHLLNAGLCFGW